MTQTVPRGRFVWHELMTTDPDAAIGFYPKVVGWTVQPFAENPGYRMWAANGAPLGGVMELPEQARSMGSPSHWLPYVAVPDIDATVRQATSLGARTYVPPTDISVGRFAVLADPQGAIFAVYKSAGEMPGHDGAAKMGEFSWHELVTTDVGAAWNFYHALFGWDKTTSMDMGPDGVYQMFGRAGTDLGGIYTQGPAKQSHWLSYVRVPNADAGAALATRLGGRLVTGPMEVPGGSRIAVCVDPQGAAFAVHSIKQKQEASHKKPATAKPVTKKKAVAAKKKAAPAKKKVAAKAKKKVAAKKRKTARPKARVVKKKAKATRKPARRGAPKRVVKKSKKKARHR